MSRIDLLAPFRWRPAPREGDYSASHQTKGTDYHNRYNDLPGRRLAWRFEREFLLATIAESGRRGSHLDFAGGTGRIAGALSNQVESQTILDISASMLSVAARHVPGARIVCGDFRSNPDLVPARAFDLVTAFRFFPNAEESLREAAMAYVARALVPGGIFVCNNHRQFWSIPYIAGRLILARAASEGMLNRRMVDLAARHGLRLTRTQSIGVIPQTDRKALLPWTWVDRIETGIWKHAGSWHGLGYDVLYVFENPRTES